jgi:hypothetical protein
MAKPTDFQKRVIAAVLQEISYWDRTNDIHSPSHATSIESEMFHNLEEYDFGCGPKDLALAVIAEHVTDLWVKIADLEPSGR